MDFTTAYQWVEWYNSDEGVAYQKANPGWKASAAFEAACRKCAYDLPDRSYERCYSMAYERGHSGGYGEVLSELVDIVTLALGVLEDAKAQPPAEPIPEPMTVDEWCEHAADALQAAGFEVERWHGPGPRLWLQVRGRPVRGQRPYLGELEPLVDTGATGTCQNVRKRRAEVAKILARAFAR